MDTPRTAEQTYGSKEQKMSATQMAHEIMSGGEHSKAILGVTHDGWLRLKLILKCKFKRRTSVIQKFMNQSET